MLKEMLLAAAEAVLAFLVALALVGAMGNSIVMFALRVLFISDGDLLADA